ncbi:uncharacterized protein IL334_003831 [Kwoniella shivajii]|uniref:F-box domain-containing protein n=1 Tax=Kwoniella shivajii TaxID=564305 RepID=A0ABZ1CZ87_9TREE|nr:hypothetical protein IL334_003831 [Kwoniella shivajii]
MDGLASTQLGGTADIVSQIVSYLPQSSLFATLQVSKSFFHASVPHLYHTLTIKHDFKNIFTGATRPDNLTFDTPSNDDQTQPLNEINKNSLLRYIKRVDVFVHSTHECPFVLQYIQPLPNLEVVHLARGPRGKGFGFPCEAETCQFINKVCVNAKKAIIRQLDFTPLSSYKSLKTVVLKLRICELPIWYGQGLIDYGEYHMSKSEISLPHSVKKLDMVWWDADHKYRLDSYEAQEEGSRYWHGGRDSGMRTMKGCTYCDQSGCRQYSPHVGIQIPAMVECFAQDFKLDQIRLWNVGGSIPRPQWGEEEFAVEELKEMIVKSFSVGRQKKSTLLTNSESDSEDMMTFHSGLEYLSYGLENDEIDQGEWQYWEDRYQPSFKLQELREQVSKLITLENIGYPTSSNCKDDMKHWSKDDCWAYLARHQEKQRKEEETEARMRIRDKAEARQESEEEHDIDDYSDVEVQEV